MNKSLSAHFQTQVARQAQETRQELIALAQEHEILQQEHAMATRQLKLHETREKKRTDGLKKAQQSRKKKGAKK